MIFTKWDEKCFDGAQILTERGKICQNNFIKVKGLAIKMQEEIVMKKELSKLTSEKVAKVLRGVLCMEANSTSCYAIYEPKAPKKLENFKKNR